MKRTIVLLAAVVLLPADAQEDTGIDPSNEEGSGRYAECAAYYELVVAALSQAGENETAQAYRTLGERAMLYALALATPGRNQAMAVEVTNARIDLSKKQMMTDADGRNENLSILINRHQEGCTQAVQNPSEALLALLAEAARAVDAAATGTTGPE